ncbi:MAG: DUF6448 family protein [Methanoculleus sp.]
MPPHCDTRDGPVVRAAEKALEKGNVNYVLIWVPKESERELADAFEGTMKVRKLGEGAKDLADDWFFETAIRLHRAGEGAPYTGLKPAGLDEGPVVPRAEKAIETGDAGEVIRFVLDVAREDLQRRFHAVIEKKHYDPDDVVAGRAYVQAFIDFVVYTHHLYRYVKGGEKHEGGGGGHSH